MSGQSFSFTFPILPSDADAAARAIIDRDTSPLDGYATDNANFLVPFSRNNWLEYHVYLLVEGFKSNGLSYLSHSFDGKDHPTGGWFGAALHAEALPLACEGVRALIANLPRDVIATSRLLGDAHISSEDIALLTNFPLTISETFARYESSSSANEGDDIPSLITFLQAHLSVLEFAQSNSLSVVYAVYLY